MTYGTPPPFSSSQRQPPRSEIDFQVISDAFNLLLRHWQVYIIPGLVMLLIMLPQFVVAYAPFFTSMSQGRSEPYDPFATFWLQIGLSLAGNVVSMLMYPGIARFTMNVVRGLPASSSDFWEGFRRPLEYIAIAVFTTILASLGLFACCIGSLIVMGLMMFALPIKVDTELDPLQSIGRSWEMLKPHWLMASVFFFVAALVSELGAIACGIGVILTMPFIYIAPTLLYCQFVGILPARTSDPISPYPRG